MVKSRFTAEQIILKLREAEVEQAKGKTIEEVCRKLGIVDKTYYRWRKECRRCSLSLAVPGRTATWKASTASCVMNC